MSAIELNVADDSENLRLELSWDMTPGCPVVDLDTSAVAFRYIFTINVFILCLSVFSNLINLFNV
jgi:hypothetical protein